MYRLTIQRRSARRVSFGAVCLGEQAIWSRPISARADSKFAPCMARPNLFSGD